MRIAIPTLPSPESVALKTMLENAGYLVVTEFPSYTVNLKRGTHPWIVVDVPDAVFGRLLTHRIGELAPWDGVFVKALAGNQNDKAAVIEIPDADAKALEAVCVGTMRALDQVQKIATEPARVAAAPFLNASELLANAVEVITTRINAASTTSTQALSEFIAESHTTTRVFIQQQSSTTQRALDDVKTHVSRVGVSERVQLFSDFMSYHDRPRWWQWKYWRN